MGKRQRKTEKVTEIVNEIPVDPAVRIRAAKPVQAKTPGQKNYLAAITNKRLVFGIGPAGTGKTFLATAMAADALRSQQTDKLILTRPAVEAGESLGFLPGELEQKFDPYFRPVRDVLERQLGKSFVNYAIKHGRIEAMPLAYMRGMTFEDCWVILDEAQNTTPAQMKLFLTRLGENAKMLINGDLTQSDVPGRSGLLDAVDLVHDHPAVSVVEFGTKDVVRSGLVHDILLRYEERVRAAQMFPEDFLQPVAHE